jgi:hypothetical protein
VELLGGTAITELAAMPPTLAYYGHPPTYDHDPIRRRRDRDLSRTRRGSATGTLPQGRDDSIRKALFPEFSYDSLEITKL